MRSNKISKNHRLLAIIFSLLFIIEASFAVNNETNSSTQNVSITPITTYLLSDDVCSVSGDWVVKLDWYCDGNYDYGNVTFKKDGTFIAYDDQSQYTGTWNESNKSITWNFDNHLVSYHGTVNAACSAMVGSMRASNGATGCWSATRQNTLKSNTLLSDQTPWFPIAD